jgi:hypothetical protein
VTESVPDDVDARIPLEVVLQHVADVESVPMSEEHGRDGRVTDAHMTSNDDDVALARGLGVFDEDPQPEGRVRGGEQRTGPPVLQREVHARQPTDATARGHEPERTEGHDAEELDGQRDRRHRDEADVTPVPLQRGENDDGSCEEQERRERHDDDGSGDDRGDGCDAAVTYGTSDRSTCPRWAHRWPTMVARARSMRVGTYAAIVLVSWYGVCRWRA